MIRFSWHISHLNAQIQTFPKSLLATSWRRATHCWSVWIFSDKIWKKETLASAHQSIQTEGLKFIQESTNCSKHKAQTNLKNSEEKHLKLLCYWSQKKSINTNKQLNHKLEAKSSRNHKSFLIKYEMHRYSGWVSLKNISFQKHFLEQNSFLQSVFFTLC